MFMNTLVKMFKNGLYIKLSLRERKMPLPVRENKKVIDLMKNE